MKRFFGIQQSTKPSENAPMPNLPSSWYRSEAMYNLERRAIFSRKWLLVSHELRFTEPGTYLQLQEVGFPFFLIRDRQGKINGFHNVCCHRAYPIFCAVLASLMTASGWSYGLNGKLAKAPRYQELEGFEKDQNGLLLIHVHIDKYGFIWVNLDGAENPTVAWDDDFAGYHFDHTWEMIGDYNGKTLADNYNECYHCPTGHPGIVQYTDLSKYWVETKAGHIQHHNTDWADAEGMGIVSTFYFPNASMTVSPDFFYLMRCVPLSPSKTHMQYEVYRHNEASDDAFHKIDSIFKQVLKEDKDLCNAAQRNLNAGVYVNGKLHPQHEKGPLFFQQSVKHSVIKHYQTEEEQGGEIWPASSVSSKTRDLDEEIELCRKIDCHSTSGSSGPLAW
ncbi:hypothetical protein BDV06DRAFT_215579 [Aspergillus oleicola]